MSSGGSVAVKLWDIVPFSVNLDSFKTELRPPWLSKPIVFVVNEKSWYSVIVAIALYFCPAIIDAAGTIGEIKSVSECDTKVTLSTAFIVADTVEVAPTVVANSEPKVSWNPPTDINSVGLIILWPEEVSILEVKWSKSNLPYCVLSSTLKKSILPV